MDLFGNHSIRACCRWPAYGQMAAPVATNMAITAHLKITITGGKVELPIADTLPIR